jgi:hypothetical protein
VSAAAELRLLQDAQVLLLQDPTLPVGGPVADLLRVAAGDLWAYGPLCCPDGCVACDGVLWAPYVRAALAVARAVTAAPGPSH